MSKDTPEKLSFLQYNLLRLRYLFRSLEGRFNRPLIPRERERSFLGEWDGGATIAALADARPRVLVTITTYKRPAELTALIEALARPEALPDPGCWVVILNDKSESDYGAAKAALGRHFPGRHLWLDAREPMGKRRFWRTHQVTFLAARTAQAEFLLSLQDDIALAPRFGELLWSAWAATGRDPGRRVLYLFTHPGHGETATWVDFRRVTVPGLPAARTDWFDLQGFLIDRAGLALLRYWVIPITGWRWRRRSAPSSGVGRQLTRRLFGRASTWQCDPPLVFHGAAPSEMNPEARGRNPLDNRALFPGADAEA